MDEVVVYDALTSGAYVVDGAAGIFALVAAGIAVLAGLIVLAAGIRGSRRPRVAAGAALMLAGLGGIAALEIGPVRDRRDVASGRYALSTGTVIIVSPAALSIDKVEFATPCVAQDGKPCAGAAVGDRVRVAYRADDLTEEGPRALRVWRLPAPPAEPVTDAPDSIYAPPEVARSPAATPTTRSSGGLTVRLIPGRLGQ